MKLEKKFNIERPAHGQFVAFVTKTNPQKIQSGVYQPDGCIVDTKQRYHKNIVYWEIYNFESSYALFYS